MRRLGFPTRARNNRAMLGHDADGGDGRPQSLAPLLEGSETAQLHRTLRLCIVVCIITLGTSFQFGFGLSSLNNLDVLGPAATAHPIPLTLWSLVVAAFGVGGLIGSTFASFVVLSLSRRTALYICSALVLGSSALLGLGTSWQALSLGRLLVGVVAGIGTSVVPLYLQELAPARLRASLGIAHQLGLGLGGVAALAVTTPGVLGTPLLWRYAFFVPAALAALQACALPCCPESPRFVYNTLGSHAAIQRLAELHAERNVEVHIDAIRGEAAEAASAPSHGGTLSIVELLAALIPPGGAPPPPLERGPIGGGPSGEQSPPALRRQLLMAIVLQLAMQLCGVDAILYYSTSVLRAAGLEQPERASALLALAHLLALPPALAAVERLGRRPLLLVSWAGMAACYALATGCLLWLRFGGLDGGVAVAASGAAPDADVSPLTLALRALVTASLAGVLAFFALGPGTTAWCVIAEIVPPHARNAAMAVGIALNWIGNVAVGLAFPWMLRLLGPAALGVFALLSLVFCVFTHRCVPETKDRSLADVAREIAAGGG